MSDCFHYPQNGWPKCARLGINGFSKIWAICCVLIGAAVLNFAAPASCAYAAPQEYEGEIKFAESENVRIHFYLSNDGKKITKIDFSMDDLYLKPKKKDSSVSNVSLMGASLTNEKGYEIINGKLKNNSFFIFDLTVVDSCVYGSIGIEYTMEDGEVMVADPVYSVIPNITTPMKIPENILKP
jgi:hypothetical protein